jgi:hypothetical protein
MLGAVSAKVRSLHPAFRAIGLNAARTKGVHSVKPLHFFRHPQQIVVDPTYCRSHCFTGGNILSL